MASARRILTNSLAFCLAGYCIFGTFGCAQKRADPSLPPVQTNTTKYEPAVKSDGPAFCQVHECAQVRYARDEKGEIIMMGDQPLFEGYSKEYRGAFGRTIETYVLFDRPVTISTITQAVPMIQTDDENAAKKLAAKIRKANPPQVKDEPQTTDEAKPVIAMSEENIRDLGGEEKLQQAMKTDTATLKDQLIQDLRKANLFEAPAKPKGRLSGATKSEINHKTR